MGIPLPVPNSVGGGSARLALHPAIVLNGESVGGNSSLRPLSSCSGEVGIKGEREVGRRRP